MTGLLYVLMLVIVLIGFAAVLRGPWFVGQAWHASLRQTWPWCLGAIVLVWGAALWMQLSGPQPAPPVAGWLRADNMNGIFLTQAWGSPGFGHSVGGNPLRIGKENFEHGIGTHAEGMIRLRVPPDAVEFVARAGVDAEATGGLVQFEVLADDQSVWKSGPVASGAPAVNISVPTIGRHELKLLTHALGSNDQDHADWVNLAFRIDPQAAAAGN